MHTHNYDHHQDDSILLFMQWLWEFEEELFRSVDLDKMEEDHEKSHRSSTTSNDILSQNLETKGVDYRVNLVTYRKEPIKPLNNPNYDNSNKGA
jgi:hypothetical protein